LANCHLGGESFGAGIEVPMNNDDVAYDDVLESTMVELTSNFAGDSPAEDALGAVTSAAVELIKGVDYADVLLIEDGEFRSVTPIPVSGWCLAVTPKARP
jgi:hypothetical protein